MILRIWQGWTTPENADAYEAVLKGTVIPGILAMKVAGFRGIEVLRRPAGDEVEFVTIMRFDALAHIKSFAGEDYEKSYVIPQAHAVLKRYEPRARHFELRHTSEP